MKHTNDSFEAEIKSGDKGRVNKHRRPNSTEYISWYSPLWAVRSSKGNIIQREEQLKKNREKGKERHRFVNLARIQAAHSNESRTKTISQWRHHLFCDSLTHRLIGIRQTYPGLEPDTAAKPDLIPMASHLSPFQFHSQSRQFPLPDRRYSPFHSFAESRSFLRFAYCSLSVRLIWREFDTLGGWTVQDPWDPNEPRGVIFKRIVSLSSSSRFGWSLASRWIVDLAERVSFSISVRNLFIVR